NSSPDLLTLDNRTMIQAQSSVGRVALFMVSVVAATTLAADYSVSSDGSTEVVMLMHNLGIVRTVSLGANNNVRIYYSVVLASKGPVPDYPSQTLYIIDKRLVSDVSRFKWDRERGILFILCFKPADDSLPEDPRFFMVDGNSARIGVVKEPTESERETMGKLLDSSTTSEFSFRLLADRIVRTERNAK